MRDLQKIQNEIQHYLLHQAVALQNHGIDITHSATKARLAIYQDGYYLRLLEVLQQDYAVLAALLGESQFEALARSFIKAHPSHFRSIRWFGGELPDFMQGLTIYNSQPWLIEMAKFEWLMTESFDAEDSAVLTLDAMAAVPMEQWPDMYFQIIPSLRRLSLRWNIAELWKAVKEDHTLIEPRMSETAVNWIIWRKGLQTLFYSLTPDAAYMLDAIQMGKNFGTICEGLCAWVDEDAVSLHAALLLKRFIMDDLLQCIYF